MGVVDQAEPAGVLWKVGERAVSVLGGRALAGGNSVTFFGECDHGNENNQDGGCESSRSRVGWSTEFC